MSDRCPRCGLRSNAVAVKFLLAPELRGALLRHVEIIRRELGIETDGEALAEAARRLAVHLHQGT